MKIAIATKDGISINLHFGHAKEFWIYQIEDNKSQFIERREVENYCLGNSSSKTAMGMILETIKDCQAVFVAKIGDGPKEKLAVINVAALDDYAYLAVNDSIDDYAQKLATNE